MFYRVGITLIVALGFVMIGAIDRTQAEPTAAPPRIDTDPTTAPIADPPPRIRNPLDDATYVARYAAALRSIGAASPPNELPETFGYVSAVKQGSPAWNAGLRPGDGIDAVNNKATASANDVRDALSASAAVAVVDLVSCHLPRHRQIKIVGNGEDVDISDGWLLEGQYLHALPAKVPPVDALRVAASCADSDPQLAESAIFHAQSAGGPGSGGGAVDAIAALALFNDSWYDEALAYGASAWTKLPGQSCQPLRTLISESALATFRFPYAQLGDQAGLLNRHKVLANAAAEASAYQSRQRTVPLPNPIAAEIAFVDRTADLIALPANENSNVETAEQDIASARQKRLLPFSAPDGHYTSFICGPIGTAIDFSGSCHFAASDAAHGRFDKVLRIGILNNGQLIRELELYLNGLIVSSAGPGMPDAQLNLLHLFGNDQRFEFRLAVVGDRYEFVMNSRRIFYGPLSELSYTTPKLGLLIQSVGVTGDFTNMRWATAGPTK